jgi:hypothetical protein
MWDLQRLTTLWAFTAWYKDSFTFFSGSGLENGRGDSLRWLRDTLYPLKLALTSPTSGGRSVGRVRLRTKPTEFVVFLFVEQSAMSPCT